MNIIDFANQIKNYNKFYRLVLDIGKELLLTNLAKDYREYLNLRVSEKAQKLFEFGYFPDDYNLDLLINKIKPSLLERGKLIYPYHVQNGSNRVWTYKGFLNNHNLFMPYLDLYGNIVAFIGRTNLPDLKRKELKIDKYKSTQFNKSLHLFGLYQAKKYIVERNYVIIVEGQIDCISCHEYGLNNVVALGGVTLTKYQFCLLRRLTDRIYLILDNDLEGRRAEEKIIKKYSEHAIISKLNLPSSHKDIDSFLNSEKDSKFIFNQLI